MRCYNFIKKNELMNPVKERKFFEVTDKAFKVTLLLQQFKLFNSLVIFIINTLLKSFQVIFERKRNDTKRLLIICLHRLGDTVFCVPAIEGIIDCFKDYEIFIITYHETKKILGIKFNENKIVAVDKNDFFLQRRIAKNKSKKAVINLKPEIIFDLTGNPASASLILNSKARKVIGTNLPYFKTLYTGFAPIREIPHFMDIYIDVLKKERPGYNGYCYKFKPDFNPNGKILIHPFAIRKAKEWNLNKYIELSKRLGRNYEVSITAPPNFIQDEILNEIAYIGTNIIITNTVNDLIEEVKQASLFISNDSGPTYIASILGKPTFTIYGPTNPEYSLPFGKNHEYFQKKLACSVNDEKFCFTLGGVNCPSYECLNLISVDEVENSVIDFAKKIGIKTKSYKNIN